MKIAFNVEAPVSYCGVDSEAFFPLPQSQKSYSVVSVGELSARKGFDFLVESLARIPADKRPDLVLACNRVDPLEQEYVLKMAAQLGVRVSIRSHLNTTQLNLEYNQALFCIYSPVLEPFGLVPLEAMACGIPVVGVREGGVLETIDHRQTGLLAGRNPDQFASAVLSLLEDPDRRTLYGRRGRECVLREWTWEKSTASLDEHFAACVTSPAKG
jgi:glycosyltransferase involved in cell wall biosynthesis